jgi:predicted nucleic acid-binding protein
MASLTLKNLPDDLLRALREVAVIERRAAASDGVVTTWMTAAELYHGAAKSTAAAKNRALVTSFLATRPSSGSTTHRSRSSVRTVAPSRLRSRAPSPSPRTA